MVTPLILLIFIPVMIAGALDEHGGTVNVSDDLYYIELKEVDMQLWNENFKKANALSDYGDYFLEYAELFNIDPIVLVAISMKETNWGVSREVRENNKQGDYSEDNEDLKFENLEERIKRKGDKQG